MSSERKAVTVKKVSQKGKLVIDFDKAVLGRAASVVAKKLLNGEKIIIVNAEKAIITGNSRKIIDHYKNKHQIKTASNPRRGPFTQKQPDRIVRRTIRGMLPYTKTRGKEAFRNCTIYIGVPDSVDVTDAQRIPEAELKKKVPRYVTVERISNEFGWTNKGKRPRGISD